MPSIQSADTVRINADLLRRLAAAIGLAGEPLAAVCERIVSDIRAEVAPIDGAARLDPSPDTVEDACGRAVSLHHERRRFAQP